MCIMHLGHSGNFEKASRETTDAFGVGYDYSSVMHYSSRAFSKNGQPTIVPRVSDSWYHFHKHFQHFIKNVIDLSI